MHYHDNEPSHTALFLQQFLLTSKRLSLPPQTPHRPDSVPCNYFLFPRVKMEAKGHHFQTTTKRPKSCSRSLRGQSKRIVPERLTTAAEALALSVRKRKGTSLKEITLQMTGHLNSNFFQVSLITNIVAPRISQNWQKI